MNAADGPPAGRSGADAGGEAHSPRVHEPVLLQEAVDGLALHDGHVLVDCTVGGAGHAVAFAAAIAPTGVLLAIDRDREVLEHARARLAKAPVRVSLFHRTFSELAACLEEAGHPRVDRMFLDLGVSSYQLDTTERGFSFMRDAPLDLRMDQTRGPSAAEFLRSCTRDELYRVLRELGEEPFAGRIARVLLEARERGPIDRTTQLADLVASAVPAFRRRGRIHPATLTFMALRMAVNRELEQLDAALQASLRCLRPGGRLGVISFHSLEDRRVKEHMRAHMDPLARKPIVAGAAETLRNPRARSARLRIAGWRAPP
jgi:16S rRNA (cytosine1402-N4)-methyltransferase